MTRPAATAQFPHGALQPDSLARSPAAPAPAPAPPHIMSYGALPGNHLPPSPAVPAPHTQYISYGVLRPDHLPPNPIAPASVPTSLRDPSSLPSASPPAPLHVESPSLPPPITPPPADVPHWLNYSSTSRSRYSGLGLIGSVVAAAIVIIVIAVGCLFLWRKGKRRKTSCLSGGATTDKPRAALQASQLQREYPSSAAYSTELFPPSHVGPRSFSYEQLSISTNNFSESELLGRGGFGFVYKGKLDDADGATFVAVKRLAESSSQGDKEFNAEVTIIGDLRHRNLVKLKGWCCEQGKFLLVYDYMPNGSLDHLLFNDTLCARLSWEKRYSIALGLGSALQYLHDECDNVIIHRDIKSSNVLLDECFTAKLGDFGLSRQMDQGSTARTTTVAGTRGYMAPECLVGLGKATRETDVYAFGTVLLELVSGKRAIEGSLQEHDGMLVEWVWHLHSQGRVMEAVDERMRGVYDREEGMRVIMVGLVCASPDPKARPKIRSAVEALRGSVALPLVPLFKPTLTFVSPTSMSTTSSTSSSIHHQASSSSSSSISHRASSSSASSFSHYFQPR